MWPSGDSSGKLPKVGDMISEWIAKYSYGCCSVWLHPLCPTPLPSLTPSFIVMCLLSYPIPSPGQVHSSSAFVQPIALQCHCWLAPVFSLLLLFSLFICGTQCKLLDAVSKYSGTCDSGDSLNIYVEHYILHNSARSSPAQPPIQRIAPEWRWG